MMKGRSYGPITRVAAGAVRVVRVVFVSSFAWALWVARGAPALHALGFHELVSQQDQKQQGDQWTYRGAKYVGVVDHLYPQGVLVAQGGHSFGGDDDGIEALVQAGLALDHAVGVVAWAQVAYGLVVGFAGAFDDAHADGHLT